MTDVGDYLWKIWVLICSVVIGPFILILINRVFKRSDDLLTRVTALEKTMMTETKMLALHHENKQMIEKFSEHFDRFEEASRKDRHDLRERMHEIGAKSAEDRILLRGINERAAEDRGMLIRALEKMDDRNDRN
jgi:hypothetical protein